MHSRAQPSATSHSFTAYSAISRNGHQSSSLEISMVIKAMINQNSRATCGTLAGRINGNRSLMVNLFSSLMCLESSVAWHFESSITSLPTMRVQELYEDERAPRSPLPRSLLPTPCEAIEPEGIIFLLFLFTIHHSLFTIHHSSRSDRTKRNYFLLLFLFTVHHSLFFIYK